ncbi:pyrroline-5-carboxylate reductase [Breznakiella homolactica]|uniref:Pyrroline-5-carboxylate reductase n=1 Tax=Breznakiella homolactica TaxID=2798577 RepID=A0A7T7XNM2_9SPIR|nr:pyrroline-5-carboxylate reductase [Breznakiella homolactica]QQO09655.1 pyrroline-5-carboxylate reductase [Breznakiella homolactica]
MDIRISCIGSGNMGGALMRGAAKITGGKNITFTDADTAKAETLARDLGASVLRDNSEAARYGDYIFLAVKPQILPGVLKEIAPVLRERFDAGNPGIVVSMAAGFTIGAILSELANPGQPAVRMMPNTPALIARGVIAYTPSQGVPDTALARLNEILSETGIVDRVPEEYLDGVTALSGSGPAFTYMFIEALAEGGVRAGLPRELALKHAAQTVLGAAAMVQETGRTPEELTAMVASPGGTTLAGIGALEKGGFTDTAAAAVDAAFRRAGELGRRE